MRSVEPLTKSEFEEVVTRRLDAWNCASSLVSPIVELHGLTEYKSNSTILAGGYTTTAVDQHVGHIIHVANWLLDEEEA